MTKMGLNQLRDSFLEFFKGKEHLILPSFSLVPKADKSLLLINSGMAPLKPYFTGQETPPRRRVVTCQKCIRTPDIERVGRTTRHATFFEMLGNFSFGDYFKKEAILWAWEYITEVLRLPIDRLWITVYKDDGEAFKLWTKDVGIEPNRVIPMGKEDNFWEIGVGPCGPCSEIFFDKGKEQGCGEEDCAPGCDCDRFVEFWNLVFTQFNKDEMGNYNPLEHPSIDTGMGLERIAAIMQDVDSIFEVDTMKNIMEEVSRISGIKYGEGDNTDVSLRVITDHIRSTVFMVADGILPSNEGRGYVLRRILRRAARHGKLLGIKRMFLADLIGAVIKESGMAYPELAEKREYILRVISIEEERFNETIDQGLSILKEYIKSIKEKNKSVLDGKSAFKLYDTYGFPLDLTKEILDEEGLTIDEATFNLEMEAQRERARAARHETDYMGMEDFDHGFMDSGGHTDFIGYDTLETHSQIIGIIKDKERVEYANAGDQVWILLDKTPFYAEGGGQVADKGFLLGDSTEVEIDDVTRMHGDHIVHKGTILTGSIRVDDTIMAKIQGDTRLSTARNHSVTHLLHQALKDVLGDHVEQAGSLVSPDRLRFDFTHFAPLNPEEIDKIEKVVNQNIMAALPVNIMKTTYEKAKELGAMALFGEKYGDEVRVVKMGDYSVELCGGTHLTNTGQAGLFRIITEAGIAAGVRRIEAVTGVGAYQRIKQQDGLVHELSHMLKTNPNELIQRTEGILRQIKEHEQEIQGLKRQLAQSAIDELILNKKTIGSVSFVAAKIENQDMEGLREIADIIRNKLASGVVVLASHYQDKVNLVAAATKDIVKMGVHSGHLIREIAKVTEGGGGGRPDMAQAGGKNPSKILEALDKVKALISQQIDTQ